jgi:hypothetical protein
MTPFFCAPCFSGKLKSQNAMPHLKNIARSKQWIDQLQSRSLKLSNRLTLEAALKYVEPSVAWAEC